MADDRWCGVSICAGIKTRYRLRRDLGHCTMELVAQLSSAIYETDFLPLRWYVQRAEISESPTGIGTAIEHDRRRAIAR